MLNLFPRHQYMDTSVSSVYFQGLCRQQWLKAEILSVAVTTVSIDPKWQSQDLKPLLRPITQKDTIERWFCSKHFTMCSSEKRWQRGANQQIKEYHETGSLVSRNSSNFSLPGAFSLLVWLDTTSVPAIGTEALLGWGPVICTAHTNGLFYGWHFPFICYSEPAVLLKSKI